MSGELTPKWNLDALPKGDFYNEGKEYKEFNEEEDGVACGVGGLWDQINGNTTILTRPNSSNRNLHLLARKVRGWEKRKKRPLTPEEYFSAFQIWESGSKPFLREDNDYFSEFLAKLNHVTVPEGETLLEVFKCSQGTPPPTALCIHPNEKLQHFGSFCRELHSMSKGCTLLLAQDPIAKLFGCSQRTISTWISALVTLGVLKPVKKGTKGNGASTYLYLES